MALILTMSVLKHFSLPCFKVLLHDFQLFQRKRGRLVLWVSFFLKAGRNWAKGKVTAALWDEGWAGENLSEDWRRKPKRTCQAFKSFISVVSQLILKCQDQHVWMQSCSVPGVVTQGWGALLWQCDPCCSSGGDAGAGSSPAAPQGDAEHPLAQFQVLAPKNKVSGAFQSKHNHISSHGSHQGWCWSPLITGCSASPAHGASPWTHRLSCIPGSRSAASICTCACHISASIDFFFSFKFQFAFP